MGTIGDDAPPDVTDLLRAWSAGDRRSGEEAIAQLYAELRRRAAARLRRERRNHTLDATGLVHELYLRLDRQHRTAWQSRAHFFAVASKLMRRILVDHARRRHSAKRGGTWCKIPFDENTLAAEPGIDVASLDGALEELAARDARQGLVVELRYFGGLSIEEAAEALDVSPATVKREWRMAKAWLYSRLSKETP
jgi:RNA polymerase sigma factor (TIGR02999 family)